MSQYLPSFEELVAQGAHEAALISLTERRPSQERLNAALLRAGENHDLVMLRILLAHGGDANQLVPQRRWRPGRGAENLLVSLIDQLEDDADEANISTLQQIIKQLIVQGIDLNRRDASIMGRTPLLMACKKHWPDIVQAMLENGADPNLRVGLHGTARTALYALFARAQIKNPVAVTRITTVLLAHGAQVDTPGDIWQRTPLMMAASLGADEAIEQLLQAGADAALKDVNGISALDIARERADNELLTRLSRSTGAQSNTQVLEGQLKCAAVREDWKQVITCAKTLAQQPSVSPDTYYLASHARTQRAEHKKAIKVARTYLAHYNDARATGRLICAQIYAGHFKEAITCWHETKSLFNQGAIDRFVLANLMAAYGHLKHYQRGLDELLPYLKNTQGTNDQGLASFNAACLYSLAGDTENALRWAEIALNEGRPVRSLLDDHDLRKLRKHPAFDLLLSSAQSHTNEQRCLRSPSTKLLAELCINDKHLIERLYEMNKHRAKTINEYHFDSRADAILDFLARLKRYTQADWQWADAGMAERYWPHCMASFIQTATHTQHSAQPSPALGALVVQCTPGATAGEQVLRLSLHAHDGTAPVYTRFSSYVFQDEAQWQTVQSGPAIDTVSRFSAIIEILKNSEAFARLNKRLPFMFSLQGPNQEHYDTWQWTEKQERAHRRERKECPVDTPHIQTGDAHLAERDQQQTPDFHATIRAQLSTLALDPLAPTRGINADWGQLIDHLAQREPKLRCAHGEDINTPRPAAWSIHWQDHAYRLEVFAYTQTVKLNKKRHRPLIGGIWSSTYFAKTLVEIPRDNAIVWADQNIVLFLTRQDPDGALQEGRCFAQIKHTLLKLAAHIQTFVEKHTAHDLNAHIPQLFFDKQMPDQIARREPLPLALSCNNITDQDAQFFLTTIQGGAKLTHQSRSNIVITPQDYGELSLDIHLINRHNLICAAPLRLNTRVSVGTGAASKTAHALALANMRMRLHEQDKSMVITPCTRAQNTGYILDIVVLNHASLVLIESSYALMSSHPNPPEQIEKAVLITKQHNPQTLNPTHFTLSPYRCKGVLFGHFVLKDQDWELPYPGNEKFQSPHRPLWLKKQATDKNQKTTQEALTVLKNFGIALEDTRMKQGPNEHPPGP